MSYQSKETNKIINYVRKRCTFGQSDTNYNGKCITKRNVWKQILKIILISTIDININFNIKLLDSQS